MTKKALLSFGAFALVTGASSAAFAQTPNCPPGSWFCADAQIQGGASVTVGVGQSQLQPLPPPQTPPPPAAPPPVVIQQTPVQPPVVVYQPAPPPVIVYRQQPDYRTYYVRRPTTPYAQREWGLNLRLEAALIGGGMNGNAGMGGFGAGLRYKPSPWFGVEAGADFALGRDYNDYARNETAFTLSGLFFLNPRDHAQVYLLAGFGWSVANVNNDAYVGGPLGNGASATYDYFGGQAGIGLEYRMTRNLALNVDLRGFIRGRTDDGAKYNPEFVDPATGKTTNTSGGALVTGGVTFYF
ncbi:MAG TPA: outer membrane beta-barrel protein [Polyangiaceae bacterium]|nr:outer membrane beta-barrel protein [Polyangiaceae bacterium]